METGQRVDFEKLWGAESVRTDVDATRIAAAKNAPRSQRQGFGAGDLVIIRSPRMAVFDQLLAVLLVDVRVDFGLGFGQQ